MISLMSALVLMAAAPAPIADRAPVASDMSVLATIDAVFAAFKSGDGPALLEHVYPEGRVTAMGTLRTGFTGMRSTSFAAYAGRMNPDTAFVERISDPVVRIDDDVAMVWAPFTITSDGKVVSCGYDHFDLLRLEGVWKIMNLTFSSRVTGCPGQ